MGRHLHVLERYSRSVQSAPADTCFPVANDLMPGNRSYRIYRVMDVALAPRIFFDVDSARLGRWYHGG